MRNDNSSNSSLNLKLIKNTHNNFKKQAKYSWNSKMEKNLNNTDFETGDTLETKSQYIGFTNPARADTTVGDLIEAIADIASAAGKTEKQGLEMAREVLHKILADKQKRKIIEDCE